MVNPDSELYRANPDWVLHYPTRPRTPMRNQLMLNLARTDVQNHLIATFDRLLSDHSISYIKWDMNRNVSEPGWPNAPVEPRELWVRYTQGVYRVWGELRARHPRVTWLSCSGGGGRADLGILRLADRVQASDNTEAIAVQGILDGFSHYLPSCAIEAWVTDAAADRLSLEFRFHAAMGNILCIGGHLAHWTPVQRAQAAALVARFKAIRHIVHLGDRYRLGAPQQDAFWGVQYLAKDRSEGVLFVFRSYLPDPAPLPVLRLQGLDPHARYTVDGFASARSGAAWMQNGLRIDLANFTSTLRLIRRQDLVQV
jgi:alpha-galactosidase